jgi:hypothetical protein
MQRRHGSDIQEAMRAVFLILFFALTTIAGKCTDDATAAPRLFQRQLTKGLLVFKRVPGRAPFGTMGLANVLTLTGPGTNVGTEIWRQWEDAIGALRFIRPRDAAEFKDYLFFLYERGAEFRLDTIAFDGKNVTQVGSEELKTGSGLDIHQLGFERRGADLFIVYDRTLNERKRTEWRLVEQDGKPAWEKFEIPMGPAITAEEKLLRAAAVNNFEVVRQLIEEGANINATNKDGKTALMFAASDAKATADFLALGAQVTLRDLEGWDALFCAAKNGDLATVKLLLAKGADPAGTDKFGMSALQVAVVYSKPEIVKHLVEIGADIEARDAQGKTALLHAVEQNRAEIAGFLLDRGADVTVKDKFGRTCFSFANEGVTKEVIRVLRERASRSSTNPVTPRK